jgi:four helix bundle protein
MSNIAEGFERDGTAEFLQFLSTAKASVGEVRSQLYAALDEGYVSASEFKELYHDAESISKMIAALMAYLRRSNRRGIKYSAEQQKLEPET